MEKKCSRCGAVKDESKFQRSFGGARKNYCTACKGTYEVAKCRIWLWERCGNRCACCGETHPQFFALDHVQNDGAEHRKKYRTTQQLIRAANREGWPKDRYQVLCHNCNMAKEYWGECPHKSGKTADQFIAEMRSIVARAGKRHRFFQEGTDFKEKRPWKRSAVGVGEIMALSGVHVGRVVPDTKHTNMKFLAACICGTEGRFATQQQATDWMQAHLSGSDANGINHNGTWKA